MWRMRRGSIFSANDENDELNSSGFMNALSEFVNAKYANPPLDDGQINSVTPIVPFLPQSPVPTKCSENSSRNFAAMENGLNDQVPWARLPGNLKAREC